MAIRGINHVTLATGDPGRAIAFYRDALGCVPRARWDGGAYLEAGTLWLCLSFDPKARTAPHPDDTHIAFDVAPDDFAAFAARVAAYAPIWRDNRSEDASLYVPDPDGHKLELHVGSLDTRLAAYAERPGYTPSPR